MRKIILTAAAVFAFGFTNAQTNEKGTIEVIPQIGYSSSNYYGESNLNNSALSSVSLGVGADFFFNDRWSLRSGLLYQPMGSKFNGGEDKLNYITVPVNANWHFGSTRKWNLNFGPSIGFLTSAKENGVNIKDQVKSTQIGLNYGIGYKIEVSENFSILLDYQGMSGLTEVPKDSNLTIKNAYGSFNVGGVIRL